MFPGETALNLEQKFPSECPAFLCCEVSRGLIRGSQRTEELMYPVCLLPSRERLTHSNPQGLFKSVMFNPLCSLSITWCLKKRLSQDHGVG